MVLSSKILVGVFFLLAFALSLTKVIRAIFFKTSQFSTSYEDLTEADLWLRDNDLLQYQTLFKQMGISSLASCGQLDQLPELPAHDEERLQRAAKFLQQRLILRQWLTQLHLEHHYNRLIQADVTSLEDVYWLEDSQARSIVGKDFSPWTAARQSLPTSKEDLESLKAELWSAVVKSSQHEDAWTWGGMLVVSVSVAGLVTLAAMTQPALAPEAKHSLLQYVTGKYLLPSNCKVQFDWKDPYVVGETVSFTVKFYQRNGQAYPICDTDNLNVEITENHTAGGCGRRIATVAELGGADPAVANMAVVKFTVRHAGQYRIAVMIGSYHVQGSPFMRTFLPGPPHPHKCVFLKHSSMVVCTAGLTHLLTIEPRDEFSNLCQFANGTEAVEGYQFVVKEIDTNDSEELSLKFEYDEFTRRINMSIRFKTEGCYHATISLHNVVLHFGDFDIIVLSSADATLVHKNVASKNHEICYEARLHGIYGEPLHKPKRVFCYVSPKQLTIKEMLLKFIPKRLVTFRLCPSTKFYFQPSNNHHSWPTFALDDGCQPRVELASRDRNVIAATFTHYLLKNIGGSETFKDKQDFFYHEVRRYHQKHHHDKMPLKIHRDRLLESSMKATKHFSVSEWCRNFEISFYGEQGLDWGGVRREWFGLVCAALFDPRNGLFTAFSDNQQALVHPNPKRPSHLKLKHYEFAGKIVGKCLYESALGGVFRQLVRARFTRSFLAQIIGLRVHYRYLEQDDPDLYLSKVKYIEENDVDSMELYFAEEEYCPNGQLIKIVDLVPNGSKIRVANATKEQYLDSLAQYRLAATVKDEVDHFLKGLNDLIPDSLLSIFDENELELLLCGTGEYSIADFRAHHVVNGSSQEFRRVLEWFWAAVANFTHEEMARLLQFTTGCAQVPPGGFSELTPKFTIIAAPTCGNLPTAHTCFNQLCLPDYDTYEQFEKALRLAITEGTEGFGLI